VAAPVNEDLKKIDRIIAEIKIAQYEREVTGGQREVWTTPEQEAKAAAKAERMRRTYE
jgi:hypothetical protein